MGKSIHPMKARPEWIVPRLTVWMSLQLAIPGGLLSSMARFRFTSWCHAATKTNTVQRESSERKTVG
jgi:hypothetical protein